MDLNTDHIQRQDDRRIEVIANGLPFWGGAPLAIDTTLVSPVTGASELRSRAGCCAGAAVQDARRAKERTYPELLQVGRCKFVVLAGNHNLPTVVGPSKSLRHPSPAQSLCPQITHAAMTAYAARLLEFNCVASTVTDGN